MEGSRGRKGIDEKKSQQFAYSHIGAAYRELLYYQASPFHKDACCGGICESPRAMSSQNSK